MSNPTNCSSTLDVLTWARHAAREDDTVGAFWTRLCAAVREPDTATAERVLAELSAYGGNTFVNVLRGGGVDYVEVAYDTADQLRPMFHAKPFSAGDLEACEHYVLGQMKIAEDELKKLCAAVARRGQAEVFNDQAERVAGQLAAVPVAVHAARVAATQVGKAAAERAAAETVEQVTGAAAKKAAQKLAEEATKQVLQRILQALSVVLLVWTAISIAGPALRVTIPAVTYVALLRRLYQANQRGL